MVESRGETLAGYGVVPLDEVAGVVVGEVLLGAVGIGGAGDQIAGVI